jgi:endonuclease/exonuclease/phosphatase (EEP) superfamily protein YafD
MGLIASRLRRWAGNRSVGKGVLLLLTIFLTGCHSVRIAQIPSGPHFTLLTYNVNWGAPRPDLTLQTIEESNAEIVCLQETTPEWERYLRNNLNSKYPFMEFRSSEGRMGGGLAFLSTVPMSEVRYIPSETGWFDGWIKSFSTKAGPVQVLNVHLRPPVGDRGSWSLGGYFHTGDERLEELQQFCAALATNVPAIIAGDFNDTEGSPPLKWLRKQAYTNALPEFDRHSPTWRWRAGPILLRRRMDHIVYSPGLSCYAAKVIRAGASDHFPVLATFSVNE